MVFLPKVGIADIWLPTSGCRLLAAVFSNSVTDDYAKDAEKRDYESESFFKNFFGPYFLCGILLNLLSWIKTRSALQCRHSRR